jgi:hypothetical protein
MSDLAAFQDRFSAALHRDGDLTSHGDDEALRAGIGVHRNTIYKALVDALRANYPTVERLMGQEWFSASAFAFLGGNLPEDPSLIAFGVAYPDFLTELPASLALDFLPGVARLDRYWTEAHIAPDAEVLSPEMLAHIPLQTLFNLNLRPHPSVRLEWFEFPAPSIWRLNRPTLPQPERFDLDWIGEGALIARPRGEVVMRTLDAPGFAFLQKCYAGASLRQAAVAALEIDVATDLKARIAEFVALGIFLPTFASASDNKENHI